MGGPFWTATDQSVGGGPIQGIERSPVVDPALQGQVPVVDSANTHVYVGTLVLIALGGLIAFHLLGFRFAGDVGVFSK